MAKKVFWMPFLGMKVPHRARPFVPSMRWMGRELPNTPPEPFYLVTIFKKVEV